MAHQGEEYEYSRHGGYDESVGTEHHEAQASDDESCHGVYMAALAQPVVSEYGGEHGREHELHAAHAEAYERAGESAERSAQHPVSLVEPCGEEQKPSTVGTVWYGEGYPNRFSDSLPRRNMSKMYIIDIQICGF